MVPCFASLKGVSSVFFNESIAVAVSVDLYVFPFFVTKSLNVNLFRIVISVRPP